MVFGDIFYYGHGMSISAADGQMFSIDRLASWGFKILGIPHIGIRQRARIIFSMTRFKRSDIVLDAGCGVGLYAFEIEKKVKEVIGVDIESKKIKQAKELCKKAKRRVRFEEKDLTRLNFKDNFDKIICSDVIEHIKNYEEALKCLSKALKKNGLLVLTFPLCTDFNKKTYKRFQHIVPGYREEEMNKIFAKNNLKIKKKKYYSGIFTKMSFNVNNKIIKYRFLISLLFYPLYLFSFLDIFSRKKDMDGIALVLKKAS